LVDWPFKDVFLDTHIYHAFNADDLASSTPVCDHNKMIVAQNIACGYGSMLRFKTCTSLPTLVGEWSLAVDDCMGIIRGAGISVQSKNFGQCKNLKERLGDEWWTLHYRDFAYRQMAVAERELGWIFWTWKTDRLASEDPSAPYWSLSKAVQSKIIESPLPDVEQACYLFVDTEPFTC